MNDPWTFSGESASLAHGDGAVTLVDGSSFVLSQSSGDFRRGAPVGLFCRDTRVLSDWVVLIGGEPLEALATIPDGPFSAAFVGRRPLAGAADSPITVVRRRHVGRGMLETVEIRNHGPEVARVELGLILGADFAGLFDVKAGRLWEYEPTEVGWSGSRVRLVGGHSSAVDATVVDFSIEPDQKGERVGWSVTIEPEGRWELCCEVGIEVDGVLQPPSHRCGEAVEEAVPMTRLASWRSNVPRITTDDPGFEQAAARASEDLGALRIFDPAHPDRVVVAAGAPWFMTLFGRDSLLSAWMTLLIDQELAVGVLAALADAQGRVVDDRSEEEPGRILHEVRFERNAAQLLGGGSVYYGTADATPLFVMLVGELARWSGRLDLVEPLLPAVDRALQWVEDYGDSNGDGFVDYRRKTDSGLENQGWKDSWDGIRYGDGRVAVAPIALAEVQAYVYAAHQARADLADALDDDVVADLHRSKAKQLQAAFHEAFWLPDAGFYAVGLDADGAPIDSLTSNIGHCLWSGIVPEEYAASLAAHLVSDDLFSGWGVRTLSSSNGGFNPVSYHCGSVWPHDTAIAVAGLSRYGMDGEADILASALVACSEFSGGRLPELFAGFSRDDLAAPIPYPTSCSPQAWAAASPLLLIRSLLGLEPDVLRGRVRLRPRLGSRLRRLHAEGIPIGGARVTVDLVDGRLQCSGLPPGVTLEIS